MKTFLLACACVAAGLTACGSTTEPTSKPIPEIGPATLVQGALAAGDSLIEYAPRLFAGNFRLLFQARSGSASDTLVADLLDANGALLARLISAGNDTSLTVRETEWLAYESQSKWRLRIRRQSGTDGRYALRFFANNRKPESVNPTVIVGQRVADEKIDVKGEIDEFSIRGNAGDEWILFGQSHAQLDMQLVDSATDKIIAAASPPYWDEQLETFSSGRIILPVTGNYFIRVFGLDPTSYAFRVFAVRRAPELTPAATSLGAVVSSAIDSVGDIDEFTFDASAGQEMNLLVQLKSGMTNTLTVQIVHGTDVEQAVDVNVTSSFIDSIGSGRFALLASGPYTVRVYGPSQGHLDEATGQYTFELYPVNRAVESGASIALDGPVVADAIDRPGDVDEYPLQGNAGQLVVLHLEASGTTGGAGLVRAELVTAGDSLLTSVASSEPLQASGYGTNYSYRASLPYSGAYKVRVQGSLAQSMVKGVYSLETYTVSPQPEHVPSTIQIGDTVSGERIDRPGDLDVFTFAGQGREVNLIPAWDPVVNGTLYATLDGDLSYRFAQAFSTSLDLWGTGRMVLSNTPYTLTVDPTWASGSYNAAVPGDYKLRIFPIDRVPEGRSAAYVLGDTISGEPLFPAGDVDEYTFQLNATTSIQSFWQGDGTSRVMMYVDGTNQLVWSNGDTVNGQPVQQFTLPAGNYRMVVEGIGVEKASLTYRLALTPQ